MKKILVALTIVVSFTAAFGSEKQAVQLMRDDAALNIFFSATKISRDSIPALQQVDEEIMVDVKRNREIHSLQLSNSHIKALKDIRLTVSLPVNHKAGEKLPVLFVLPGMYSEKDIVYYIQNPGNNIIVSYQYTFGNLNPALILQMDKLHELLLAMPAQVSASIHWLKQQDWVDGERLSMMGVSLGGHFLPLCQRFLQAQGESVNSSIFAYAGVNVDEVFADSIDKRMGKKEARITKEILKVLLTPFEPKTHIPYLNGNFLVVYGRNDTFISPLSSKRLFNLLPEPKEEVILDGGHINGEDSQLINTLNDQTLNWLSHMGALQ